MNSNVDCSACTDLKNTAPDFVQNGVTKTVCNSLKNDTGLNPRLTTLHDDCEDLDMATDCMIGMMENEVDSYDLCDWKKFMKKFISNLTQILKAIICAICGLWTNVHDLHDRADDLCEMIGNTMNPPLIDYAVMPLWESGHTVYVKAGQISNGRIIFDPDDGTLNPYIKHSQGFGISYARMEVTACSSGQTMVYEWIQPKAFLCSLKEGVQYGDVLWYCSKSEMQQKSGMSDHLWQVFTDSSWTWNDSVLGNGTSRGKGVNLKITVDPGGMGTNYIGVVFTGTTYPFEDEAGYNWHLGPLGTVPRLYSHKK